MKRSYLDYAMSVIVSRALPDVRDGLKPVHRRILHAMNEGGYTSDKPYRKSARVVGDVMGKYHPHGDSAIYDAMVRMAQDFSMRLPLLDGQGNYGSMDGDPPAAMRYTEVRMAASAHALLTDLDKDTVDFQANYDESSYEPTVLPAEFPNLLVNGASGIAVGMATNIPPHNLGEVVDACLAYVDNPEIDIAGLMEYIEGPDFPTGGQILGRSGIHQAYHTGRGSVIVRARATIEEIRKDREAIVVTEIPYQVNKSRMMERIAELVHDKKIEGISDLRDESDRDGVRVVVELKRDAIGEVVLNQLYRYSSLQTSFGVNMLALSGGKPGIMNLKEVIAAFIAFRQEVITRRTAYLLGKARDRAHMLVGLAIAVANIDPIIALIRKAKDPASARKALTARTWPAKDARPLVELIADPRQSVDAEGNCRFTDEQAKAILELRLQRLTAMERDKLGDELHSIVDDIKRYIEILHDPETLKNVLREGLRKAREDFADDRRTSLVDQEFEHDLENLIQREEMVVTLSHGGYIKRVPLSTYRAQRRGGKGRAGMRVRDEDFVDRVFVLNTHTPVLFFSSAGKVYKLKVYRLPVAEPQARGKALINLLPLAEGETISTLLPMPEDEESWADSQLMFATVSGTVRRNSAADFRSVMANGKIAMKLDEGDSIVGVQFCSVDDDVFLAASGGKCIRFPVPEVRLFKGRSSQGVRGMKLDKGDQLISMTILHHTGVTPEERDGYFGRKREDAVPELTPERHATLETDEQFLLTVRDDGFGKRSSAHDYRVTRRGGKGVINIDVGEAGKVVAALPVADDDEIMLVTDGGQLIRCAVHDIRKIGRTARGVRIFRLAEDRRVVSVAHLGEAANGDAEADGEAPTNGEAGADGDAETEGEEEGQA
ncbi:MAG: DNA gyrase subunit A [Alphaproteobacteria bacterium MarineAlpha10_Bin1]|nr:MAG: DNA gyrase subunit A [Alphaproteobacteria bacterium MarineAlpha10_Bin1]